MSGPVCATLLFPWQRVPIGECEASKFHTLRFVGSRQIYARRPGSARSAVEPERNHLRNPSRVAGTLRAA